MLWTASPDPHWALTSAFSWEVRMVLYLKLSVLSSPAKNAELPPQGTPNPADYVHNKGLDYHGLSFHMRSD